MKKTLFAFISLLILSCEKEQVTIEQPKPEQPLTHAVNVTLSPVEGGSVTPSGGTFTNGETVSFTATPAENYTFKNWSGSVSSTQNPLQLNIDGNKNITANFKEKECAIVAKDGLLIIEGESFDLKGKWRVIEDEKASGGKYIEYFGANSYQSQNLAHEISVKVRVEEAKTYLVRWYMRQPLDAEGDKSNDIWIYFPDNIGLIRKDNADFTLTAYEKFVSRDIWHTSGKKEGKGEFTYGGAINYGHNKSSWMRVRFPSAGEYILKVCARSEFLQLDKFVLSSGISDTDAGTTSKTKTETLKCE